MSPQLKKRENKCTKHQARFKKMRYNADLFSLFKNTAKGMGTEYQTNTNIEPGQYFSISRNHNWLERLYLNSWICRRIVDFYPDIMGKTWGSVVLEDEGGLQEPAQDMIERLRGLYVEGQKTANLYGDAYVVRIVDDSDDLTTPLDPDKVSKIDYSRVFDYREIQPKIDQFDGNYYNPEFYYFYPSEGHSVGANQSSLIHTTRVIRFKGHFLPPQMFEQNNYCYASVLEPVLLPLMRFDESMSHVSEAVSSFEFLTFGVKDLLDTFASGSDEERQNIEKRYLTIQKNLSSMRGAVHDKENEDVQIAGRQFSNVDNILQELRTELIASSGLTKVQLYAEHPTGLQATGESQRRVEAQQILERQITLWGKIINFDLTLIMNMFKVKTGYNWEWNSSYQESRQEELANRETIARTDKLYVDMGALDPNEVRQRFTDSHYNEELVLTLATLPEQKEQPVPDDKSKDDDKNDTMNNQNRNKSIQKDSDENEIIDYIVMRGASGLDTKKVQVMKTTVKQDSEYIETQEESNYPDTTGSVLEFSDFSPIELEDLQNWEDNEDV